MEVVDERKYEIASWRCFFALLVFDALYSFDGNVEEQRVIVERKSGTVELIIQYLTDDCPFLCIV